ncbi:MAG: N-acetylglutaminylglutamine synthetase [Gammaproteobacteria bacterium]|nr:N-acetylglutaminylglutamine synthetase [Gammaproteobacteria bacterium]
MSVRSHKKELRLKRFNAPSLKNWGEPAKWPEADSIAKNAVLDCGWGRLIFAHTFDDPEAVAGELRREGEDKRDIALYLREPHVVLAHAPQELFLDPSHTYRLWLTEYRATRPHQPGFSTRRLRVREDCEAINRLYAVRHMVEIDADFIWNNRRDGTLTYVVAEDRKSGEIIGTATGVDHSKAFSDPENGSSLWCLAVDPATPHSGVGEALVSHLAGHYQARGRAFMDLSVLHDNEGAIALYSKMGFRRVPVFCIKHKNPVNEKLFIGPSPDEQLNPYAEIIVNEARRRGVAVEVLDAEQGYFALNHGGRRIVCRESLSELTSAVAMSRCDNKIVTRRVLETAGLAVPAQRVAGSKDEDRAFLDEHGAVVVKPVRGEQGKGISVNVDSEEAMDAAIRRARRTCEEVILEAFCEGEDLRVIVIDFSVVAAAVRRPPRVQGDGEHTIRELIRKQSRRRAAATGGESKIPIDDETRRCVEGAGFGLEDILPKAKTITVRKAANLHTGGTIHDVTDSLHPALRNACEKAARHLDIPVVGLDLIVPDAGEPEYVIIEANERPGLANHEPQPTAERFVDLLFPSTVAR